MERERDITQEPDELDSLAAEAGRSSFFLASAALILVMTVILGFAV
jgi:hypothetical protein